MMRGGGGEVRRGGEGLAVEVRVARSCLWWLLSSVRDDLRALFQANPHPAMSTWRRVLRVQPNAAGQAKSHLGDVPAEADLRKLAQDRDQWRALIHIPLQHTHEAAPLEGRTCVFCHLVQDSTAKLRIHLKRSTRCQELRPAIEQVCMAAEDYPCLAPEGDL